MREIKISYLLPCYNVEKYVEECIASIMLQGIEEYEIICVDDCSSDNTYSILQTLQNENERILVLKNSQNSGVSYTRNVALKAASGEYVWFVDPDDFLYPGAAKLLLGFAQNGEDYIAGNYLEYGESFNIDDLSQLPRYADLLSVAGGENYVPISTNQHGAIAGSACLGIRKRDFILKNNLFFNEKVHMTEDVLYNFLCEQCPRSVVKVEANIYVYRVREHSATTARTPRAIERTISSQIELINVYSNFLNAADSEIKQKVENRIIFLKESCLINLTRIRNRSTVKRYLQELKKNGLYPWRRHLGKNNGIRRLNTLLIGYPFVFWLNHFLRTLTRKNY